MTIQHLLSVEWFAYMVLIFLAVSILKNGWQLLAFLVASWVDS
jgi:hypothetical protein